MVPSLQIPNVHTATVNGLTTSSATHHPRNNLGLSLNQPAPKWNKTPNTSIDKKNAGQGPRHLIRNDEIKRALTPPYEGPYLILEKHEKYFLVQINSKRNFDRQTKQLYSRKNLIRISHLKFTPCHFTPKVSNIGILHIKSPKQQKHRQPAKTKKTKISLSDARRATRDHPTARVTNALTDYHNALEHLFQIRFLVLSAFRSNSKFKHDKTSRPAYKSIISNRTHIFFRYFTFTFRTICSNLI